MYFGPTVQDFLPEGGDTRKMAVLLLGVTAVGCFVFTVYAFGLFFRFKAREYGILMALGTEKKQLKKLLFQELSTVTALSSLVGLLISVPVSFLIWKLFELFIISNEQMTYRFGATGFLPGILFAFVLACVLGIAGRRFINRSDIMEILRTQQKTEMVKEIKGWTFPVGVVLTVLGLLLGASVKEVSARVFGIGLPGVVSSVSCRDLSDSFVCSCTEPCQEKQKQILWKPCFHQPYAFYRKGNNKEYVRDDASYLCMRFFCFLRNAVYTCRRRSTDKKQ